MAKDKDSWKRTHKSSGASFFERSAHGCRLQVAPEDWSRMAGPSRWWVTCTASGEHRRGSVPTMRGAKTAAMLAAKKLGPAKARAGAKTTRMRSAKTRRTLTADQLAAKHARLAPVMDRRAALRATIATEMGLGGSHPAVIREANRRLHAAAKPRKAATKKTKGKSRATAKTATRARKSKGGAPRAASPTLATLPSSGSLRAAELSRRTAALVAGMPPVLPQSSPSSSKADIEADVAYLKAQD